MNDVTTAVRSAFDWVFRDRRTGRIVIAQMPNIALLAWLASALLRRLVHPSGHWSTVLAAIGTISLAFWAGDEIMRGVNPWRRALGTVVLGALVLNWVQRR